MERAATSRRAVLGMDVGKASHWACLVTADGEVVANGPVANSESDLDRLFSRAEAGTLAVVDQARNIGSAGHQEGEGGRTRRRIPARARRPRGVETVRGGREDRREGRAGDREDRARDTRRAAARPGARREGRGGALARRAARPHGRLRHPRQEQAAKRPARAMPRLRGPRRPVGPALAGDARAARRRLGRAGRGEGRPRRRHQGRRQVEDRCGVGRRRLLDPPVRVRGRRGEPAGEDAGEKDTRGVGGGIAPRLPRSQPCSWATECTSAC